MASDQENDKRPQFGNRTLSDPNNVFEHNAWDNVVWDDEQEREAKQKVADQLAQAVGQDLQDQYEREAADFWDSFYGIHQNRFFKDRHWLFTEFPELSPQSETTEPNSCSRTDIVGNDVGDDMNQIPQYSAKSIEGSDCNLQTNSLPVSQVGRCTGACNSIDAEDVLSNNNINNYHLSSEAKDQLQDQMKSLNIQEHVKANRDETSYCNESLKTCIPEDKVKRRILEVGCGVGNTVFPILQTNNDPDLMVYCCDFSSTAVSLVKENVDYDSMRCHAFVCDIADDSSPVPFPDGSLDIIILIFVLSAIHPDKMQSVMNRLAKFLKPGGTILFRDYGRYDMAQLRFKKGRCLSENFYVRGDGTRVYFFTQEELRDMMMKAGLVEKQNLIDRRLQVNRGRQLKMYRVWIQCKYCKPLTQ